MNDGFARPACIRSRNCRLYALTLHWPVAMCWPLNQHLPQSNAIWPFFASSSYAPGSSGMNTPTTPIPPVNLTDDTRLFIVRLGFSWRCGAGSWHW